MSKANIDEKRLYDDLLTGYNRLVRPVAKNTDKLTVYIGLKLTQILDVVSFYMIFRSILTKSFTYCTDFLKDEKNQILTTSVWVRQVCKLSFEILK